MIKLDNRTLRRWLVISAVVVLVMLAISVWGATRPGRTAGLPLDQPQDLPLVGALRPRRDRLEADYGPDGQKTVDDMTGKREYGTVLQMIAGSMISGASGRYWRRHSSGGRPHDMLYTDREPGRRRHDARRPCPGAGLRQGI